MAVWVAIYQWGMSYFFYLVPAQKLSISKFLMCPASWSVCIPCLHDMHLSIQLPDNVNTSVKRLQVQLMVWNVRWTATADQTTSPSGPVFRALTWPISGASEEVDWMQWEDKEEDSFCTCRMRSLSCIIRANYFCNLTCIATNTCGQNLSIPFFKPALWCFCLDSLLKQWVPQTYWAIWNVPCLPGINFTGPTALVSCNIVKMNTGLVIPVSFS